MIYLTSDLHFGHEKDFIWQPRGFSYWEENAEIIIQNYNARVQENDIVYILGDCVLKNDSFGIECLKRLKGRKFLAFGNHDTAARLERYAQENIFESIQYGYRIKEGKMSFYLQHYPAMMGNYKDKHPTICLAGHTHSPNKFQNMAFGCYNIAVDAHNCTPISLPQIIADIKEYREKYPLLEYVDKTPYCEFCAIKNTCQARINHDLSCSGFIKEN